MSSSADQTLQRQFNSLFVTALMEIFENFDVKKYEKNSGKIIQILTILTSKSPGQNIFTSKFSRFARILTKKAKKFSFWSRPRILPEFEK
jgi:hypothetical protein